MIEAVDIVIPVLMPSNHLQELRKYLNNTCDRIKIIYVLDFGRDHNPDHKQGFSNNPKEKFVYGSFGSPGEARNAGLKICTSDYVIFWDVDDLPEIETTCTVLRDLSVESSEALVGKWTPLDNKETVLGNQPIDVGNNPGLWRWIFRRSLIGQTKFTDLMWGEDQLFLAEILAKDPNISKVDVILYRYNDKSSDSLTSSTYNAKDLPEVSKRGMRFLPSPNNHVLLVTTLMLMRQSLTMLKFGKIPVKFYGIRVLIVTILNLVRNFNWGSFCRFGIQWEY
jgi:glycosyltransferase involved in cell wall biosynthesis